MAGSQGQINWKQFLLSLFSLAILFTFFGGFIWAIWRLLAAVSTEIAAAIIAAAATVLVSVLTLVLSKRYEHKREIEQEHRKQKTPVYEDFIAQLFKMMMGGKYGTAPVSEEELMMFFSSFSQKMLVWGSDKVVQQYITYRRGGTSDGIQHMIKLEDLLYAIRADLGHKNAGLKQGDLFAMFINDIDKYLEGVDSTQIEQK
jgi:membrane protein implicated in regulation of membrane protease activity